MIKAAIIGATGYAGQELVRIMSRHPQVNIVAVASHSHVGRRYSDVYPGFRHCFEMVCVDEDLAELSKDVDVLFFCLPHGIAAEKISGPLLDKVRVIDLGSDFRLRDVAAYDKWYGMQHPQPHLLPRAVYGLSELHRTAIANASLIANPGCYATCSILALTPLLKHKLIDPQSIVIDAKSGVSGAGRSLSLGAHFNESNETIKAYKVASHRHTPEIEQNLSSAQGDEVLISFTPHLIPMNRGILVTAYSVLAKGIDESTVWQAYRQEYAGEQFIRLYDGDTNGDTDGGAADDALPETRWVKGSNFCDIGLRVDGRTGRVIVIAALDNLVKGAAGQAVQNMNIAFGLAESTGLSQLPNFPA